MLGDSLKPLCSDFSPPRFIPGLSNKEGGMACLLFPASNPTKWKAESCEGLKKPSTITPAKQPYRLYVPRLFSIDKKIQTLLDEFRIYEAGDDSKNCSTQKQ